MKIKNLRLIVCGLIPSRNAIATPQLMDGFNLGAGASRIHEPAEEMDLISTLEAEGRSTFRHRGDEPQTTPSPPPGDMRPKSSRHHFRQVYRGRAQNTSHDTRTRAPSSKRKIEDELTSPRETLNLLQGFGNYMAPESSDSLDVLPRQAPLSFKATRTDTAPGHQDSGLNLLANNLVDAGQRCGKNSQSQIHLPVPKRIRTDDPSEAFSPRFTVSPQEFLDRAKNPGNSPLSRNPILGPVEKDKTVSHLEETGSNRQIDEGLTSKHSRIRDDQFWNLEFDHELLGTSSPLPEDQMIIKEVEKYNEGTETKMKVDENNLDLFFHMISVCDYILKTQTEANLRHIYTITNPRRYYIKSQFEKLWGNREAWIAFWNQRTGIDLQMAVPAQPVRIGRIFLLFIFYVDMIEKIIPKNEGNFTSVFEHDSRLFTFAVQVFQMIQNRRNTPRLKMEYDMSTTGESILGTSSDSPSTVLWRCLKIWIDKSGRNNIRDMFFKTSRAASMFQVSSIKSFVFRLKISTRN
ncbi:hypothetical protein PSTT_12938 [Puccinia striiformis]|uniref:Uncharacterized protein n=2 Tax=Puccinia striiformis TaxID=27350 RepID=A0A2S4UTZ0_9BASI|nr:hypothetical protein PSTT_12938 [Puccinia striiformis]